MDYTMHLHKTSGKKIYADPGYTEGIYLYPGEIKKHRLTEGCTITEEQFCSLWEEYAVPRAKKRALGILVKRDCTEKELYDKLTASFHDSRSVERALAFVKEQGYVNDTNYARDYLYCKKGKKSYRQIRMELSRKGISGQILDALFDETGAQQKEDLQPQIEKYIRKFPTLDALARQKTCAHFYRKGYAAELVREILEDLDLEKQTGTDFCGR